MGHPASHTKTINSLVGEFVDFLLVSMTYKCLQSFPPAAYLSSAQPVDDCGTRRGHELRLGPYLYHRWYAAMMFYLPTCPFTYWIGMTTIEHAIPIPILHEDVLHLYAQSGTASTPTHIVNYGGAMGEQLLWAESDLPNDPK